MIYFTYKKNLCLTNLQPTLLASNAFFKRSFTARSFIAPSFIAPVFIALAFISLSLITSPSFAATEQPDVNEPTRVIKTTLAKIIAFSTNSRKIEENRTKTSISDKAKLRGFIEKQIIPNFDFDNMSHWITGPYASNMTKLDKIDFKRSLRETFLSSLSKHLGSFDAQNTRIRFHRPRYRGVEEAFVNTTVYRPDAMTVRLDFRMRRVGKTWKIIDIKANGTSAVLYYRRHFISQLRQYQNQNQNLYPQPY